MIKDIKVEDRKCSQCNSNFEITNFDLEFYEKFSPVFLTKKYSIPTPKLCPDCRQQRRLSFINESNLYKSKCNSCGKNIVSRFNPKSGLNVFCNECWASDERDYFKDGMDVDLTKSIFEQINKLVLKTPFQNLVGSLSNIENNSVYTNYTAEIVNSYMVFESDCVSDSMYSRGLRDVVDLLDCLNTSSSRESYQIVDSDNLYKCYFATNSVNCSNGYFINNCSNCNNCIGCVNLTGKQYYILNKEVSKEYFEIYLKDLFSEKVQKKFIAEFNDLKSKSVNLSKQIINSENSSGNYIFNSNDCYHSYDIRSCNNVRYCIDVNNSQDLMDVSSYGSNSNYMYESLSVGRYSRNIFFCSTVGKGEDLFYCIDVKKSKNCFACVNLKEVQYCILNKQYSKEEYEILVPKIIEQMNIMGEWGEFFPSRISPFGYNETVANEYFPQKRVDVIHTNLNIESNADNYNINSRANSKGFKITTKDSESSSEGQLLKGEIFNWSDYEAPFPKVDKIIKADMLPSDICKIPDDILNWAIECEITKKPFRIVAQELEFYRKHNLPIPKRHPDRRHLDRMAFRNPRKLFERNCDKCGIEIETTYSPERKDIVYCEECYKKEIY